MIRSTRRQLHSPFYVILLGIAVAVFLGIAIVWIDVGSMALSRALLLPLGALLLVPFFVSLFKKRAVNLLEPIFLVVFGYGLFLFIRPLYILTFNDFETMNFIGGSREAVPLALFLSIVGLTALYLGYYTSLGPYIAGRLPVGRGQVSPLRLRNYGLLVLLLGGALYGIFILGPAGGSTGSNALTASAYFYLGVDLAGAGALLLFYWVMVSPRWGRILLLFVVLATLFVLGTYLGNRYHLVYLGLSIVASFYLLRGRPFSFRSLLAFFPPAFIYVAAVGSMGGTTGSVTFEKIANFDIFASVERFFASGGDLNIFDAFTRVLTVVPESFPFVMPGRTLLYLLVHFVPRAVWPGKPLPTEVLVNQEAIGDIGPVAGGTGYGYSLPGSFYIEGGVLVILVGMFVFGVFCRTIWSYYRLHGHLLSRAILAVSLPYVLLLQRGGFTSNDAVWYLTYLVPVIVGFYYAGRKKRMIE